MVSSLHIWYDVLFYGGIGDILALFSTLMWVKLNFRRLAVLQLVGLPSASTSSAKTASYKTTIVVLSHGDFYTNAPNKLSLRRMLDGSYKSHRKILQL